MKKDQTPSRSIPLHFSGLPAILHTEMLLFNGIRRFHTSAPSKDWITTALKSSDFVHNTVKFTKLDTDKVMVFKYKGKIHAAACTCPHSKSFGKCASKVSLVDNSTPCREYQSNQFSWFQKQTNQDS